jgi:tetratricopeptide (TPR) repeat protein
MLAWAVEKHDRALLIDDPVPASSAGALDVARRAIAALPDELPRDALERLRDVVPVALQKAPNTYAAERVARALLARPDLAKAAWLHETAGNLAQRLGRSAVAILDLERAFAIEDELAERLTAAERRTQVVDLDAFRVRHWALLRLYQQLGSATCLTREPDLARRILVAFDRARSLEPDNQATTIATARALLACGAAEEAWDVASTAIDCHPAEPGGYVASADLYLSLGEQDTAATLFEGAFGAEPTNPGHLVRAAELHVSCDRIAVARRLLRRVSEGSWQERFTSVVEPARHRLVQLGSGPPLAPGELEAAAPIRLRPPALGAEEGKTGLGF